MAEKSVHGWYAQILEKGEDVEQCLKLFKELRESEKRGCRKRKEKQRERERERERERKLEKATIEKEIRLKELEIKAKEVALNEGELSKRVKFRPKVTLHKFNAGEYINVFLR